MKKYKVLWVDDQCKEMEQFVIEADNEGIYLDGYRSYIEGFEILEKNLEKYDAILLDGLFFENKNQVEGTEDVVALGRAIGKINELKLKKAFPWFVLSGKEQFTKGNSILEANKKRCFDKTNHKDVDELFQEIKKSADNLLDTQIKHDFQKVFEVCTEKYIGNDAQKPLMHILKSVKQPLNSFDDEFYFTQIRIILESMFRAANKQGLLHDKCIPGGKVNLTESSLFLTGENTKHLDVYCSEIHFSKIISESVKSIIFITGSASHTVAPDIKNNLNFSEFRKTVQTPYLLYSLTFQLMDILIWFKKYSDDNPDREKNKSYWKDVQINQDDGSWVQGKIIRIDNGWGTFKPDNGVKTVSIPPGLIKQYDLSEDEIIEITTKPDSTGTKTHINSLKKIT
jgi:hypothetical protein